MHQRIQLFNPQQIPKAEYKAAVLGLKEQLRSTLGSKKASEIIDFVKGGGVRLSEVANHSMCLQDDIVSMGAQELFGILHPEKIYGARGLYNFCVNHGIDTYHLTVPENNALGEIPQLIAEFLQ